jgi:spermidine synthase
MLVHVPMFQHPNPKRVLIVGGGDGYVLSEVLKHPSVEHVDHVDLDGEVIEVCKKHFPWGKAWDDPRVKLHVTDGAAFVKNAPYGKYDVVIQDSSDPFKSTEDGEKVELPSRVLYQKSHFDNLLRILTPDGVLNFQAETFALPSDLEGIIDWRQQLLQLGFSSVKYGTLYISSYPTGQIGFLLCEKSPKDASKPKVVKSRYQKLLESGHETSYYHPRLQRSAFDLPL